MDMSTEYLGLKLKNPLVPSASPLSKNLDTAKKLEDAGASALVMYSLFEEEVREEDDLMDNYLYSQDIGHNEAHGYLPVSDNYQTKTDEYLAQIVDHPPELLLGLVLEAPGDLANVHLTGGLTTGPLDFRSHPAFFVLPAEFLPGHPAPLLPGLALFTLLPSVGHLLPPFFAAIQSNGRARIRIVGKSWTWSRRRRGYVSGIRTRCPESGHAQGV